VATAPTIPPSARTVPATLDFALLRGALEEIPFGVATTRGDAIMYANEALARLLHAEPGGLENKPLAELFDAMAFREISQSLSAARAYDGRTRARTLDGREIDVEAHVEVYSSEAQGKGGFVILRDVSLEVGALGRLVEQLGGALFRVCVDNGVIEMLTPSITRITGLDAQRCVQRPVLLTTLLTSEERERIAFLYRRMAKGELLTANAQVSLRRADGTTRVVQIRASARRDTQGAVRHIDGAVIDAARASESGRGGHEGRGGEAASRGGDATASATMELTYEVLREASQHLNALNREIRSLRSTLRASPGALPAELAAEIGLRIDSIAHATIGASALNRAARHALARASMGATLGEVLDAVRTALTPTIGESAIDVDAGDAAGIVIPEHVDGLTLALTHLALRAFRFAGSGTVLITARRVDTTDALPHRRSAPREQVLLEVLGTAPADLADAAMEISSDVLRTVPRPDEADVAHSAAKALIAAVGGVIEIDDATFTAARSVVRLKVP
jgi:PAS domain S-box-containing protein